MKFGLYIEHSDEWMRESDNTISVWKTTEEADKWRRNHTVVPSKYQVKKVTEKIIENDYKMFSE